MKKRILSILLAVVMLVGLLPVAAFATAEVSYLEWDDVQKKLVETSTSVYEVYNGGTALAAGTTYVVNGTFTVDTRITVSGTEASPTRLILCDGASLTANAGIEVAADNALVIYGQSEGTGALTATGGGNAAGIGGTKVAGGTVIIHGGTVNANGGGNAAGIGGGFTYGAHFTSGIVIIHGGVVNANGGDGGAGIGGGAQNSGSTVTVNGGVVNATGGTYDGGDGKVAGIGGGYGSTDNGSISITDAARVLAGGAYPGEPKEISAYIADHSAKYVHIDTQKHTYTYTSDGATLIATCSETECHWPDHKLTLTLTKKGFNQTELKVWVGEGAEEPEISYYKADDLMTSIGKSEPTADGEYVVKATVGTVGNTATVTVDFDQYPYKYKGNGQSPETAYEIFALSQLEDLAHAVNGTAPYENPNNMQGVYFKLTADIGTAADPVTTTIGNQNSSFAGHFDGAGHTVTLNIGGVDVAAELASLGIDEGRLEELTHMGGMEFMHEMHGLPEDISIDDVLAIIAQGPQNRSGLFGQLGSGGEVKNVTTAGSVKGIQWVGGACGRNDGGTITNCANTCAVSGTETVGGVCGFSDGTVTNCYNVGSVSGDNSVGGVCGYASVGGTIANCYSIGRVTETSYVGGVCGWGSEITNCYFDKEAVNVSAAVGTADDTDTVKGLTTAQMQAASGTEGALVDLLNNYITANPTETEGWYNWKIEAGEYPTFKIVKTYVYSAEDNVLTATADDGTTLTLTLTESGTITEEEASAWQEAGLTLPEIVYDTAANTASITAEEATAMIELAAETLTTHSVKVICGTGTVGELTAAYLAEVLPGTTVTVAAGTYEGKAFDVWSGRLSCDGSTDATVTFIMPNEDVTLEAKFVDCYALSVFDGTNLTSTPQKVNDSITVNVPTVPEGKSFICWTAEGLSLANPKAETLNFNMPANAVMLTANFADLHTVTVTGGTIVGGVDENNMACIGTTITVKANDATDDARFTKWSSEDGVTFDKDTDSTTTFTMPDKPVTVTAETEQSHSVTVTGGTVTGGLNGANKAFKDDEITIKPDDATDDARFAKWSSEDGLTFTEAANGTFTFTMPDKPVTVTAETEQSHTVTVTGGTVISGLNGAGKAFKGDTITIKATDVSGHNFTGWTGAGVTFTDATAKETTFAMLDSDVTVTANTEQIRVTPPTAGTKTYVYDSVWEQSQTYQFADEGDKDYYTLSGNVQTDAGTYTVKAHVVDGAAWTDGTTEDKEYTFIIEPYQVEKPMVYPVVYYYSGNEQEITLCTQREGNYYLYESSVPWESVTITGNKQTDAGRHTVTATPNKNYCWDDGTTTPVELIFEIRKLPVTVPTKDSRSFTYTGLPQSYTPYVMLNGSAYDLDGIFYTLEGRTQTNAGTYTVTATPMPNYCWPDGSTGAKTYEFKIKEAQINSYIYYLKDLSGKYGRTNFVELNYCESDDISTLDEFENHPEFKPDMLKDHYMPNILGVPSGATYKFYLTDKTDFSDVNALLYYATPWDEVKMSDLAEDPDLAKNPDKKYYAFAVVSLGGIAYITPFNECSTFELVLPTYKLISIQEVKESEIEESSAWEKFEAFADGGIYDILGVFKKEKTEKTLYPKVKIEYFTDYREAFMQVFEDIDEGLFYEMLTWKEGGKTMCYDVIKENVGEFKSALGLNSKAYSAAPRRMLAAAPKLLTATPEPLPTPEENPAEPEITQSLVQTIASALSKEPLKLDNEEFSIPMETDRATELAQQAADLLQTLKNSGLNPKTEEQLNKEKFNPYSSKVTVQNLLYDPQSDCVKGDSFEYVVPAGEMLPAEALKTVDGYTFDGFYYKEVMPNEKNGVAGAGSTILTQGLTKFDPETTVVIRDTELWAIYVKNGSSEVVSHTANVSLNAKKDKTVVLELPGIPDNTEYKAVTSTNDAFFTLDNSELSSGKLTLKTAKDLDEATESDPLTFTVGVGSTIAGKEFHYDIVVTVTPKFKDEVTINVTPEGFTYGETGKTGYKDVSVTDNLVAVNDLVATYYKDNGESANPRWTKLETLPTDAGSYKVTLSVPESNETYMGSTSVEFTIAKKEVEVIWGDTALTYDPAAIKTPSATYQLLACDGSGTPDLTVTTDATNTNAGTFTASAAFNAHDIYQSNYELIESTATQQYAVLPKAVTPAITLTPAGEKKYTGSPVTFTSAEIELKDGNAVIPASEYTVSYQNNTNAGTAILIITDNAGGNYDVSGQTTFTIAKAARTTAPAAPTVSGSTVTIAAADREKKLEYSLDGENAWISVPTLNGNNAFTLSGLTVDSHTIYLREKESSNYFASSSVSKTFELTQYSVAYNANGGVGSIASQTANSGSDVTVKSGSGFSRTGYTFNGWKDENGISHAVGSTVSTGMTLYAQWTANSYTVKFNANGGSGTMESMSFTYDAAQKLSQNLFTHAGSGYHFVGWATSANGSVLYADAQSVKNLAGSGTVTLYAVWAQNVYSINVNITSPQEGSIKVKLQQGNAVYAVADSAVLGQNNGLFIGVPAGTYNIEVTQTIGGDKNVTMTQLVVLTNNADVEIALPESGVNSKLEVEEDTLPTVVGGLDEEAESNRQTGKDITVTMTVEKQEEQQLAATADEKDKATQDAISEIKAEANGRALDFMNIEIKKETKDASSGESISKEAITETSSVLELVFSYEMNGKKNIQIYRQHGDAVQTFMKLDTKPTTGYEDGKFYVDTANSLIYVYAKQFSTYAIGYEQQSGGSSTGGGGGVSSYAIESESAKNGTFSTDKKSASAGSTVIITVVPDKGYTLETLTVLDKNGKEVELTNLGNNKYSFKMPTGKVSISATFMEDNSMLNFFVDVKATDYYYDAVLWAAENDITKGTDAVHFSPNAPVTRAQVVTFLWRAAGKPVVNYAMSFVDVSGDAYYTEAVRWAVAEGITKGTSDTTFSPDKVCTRGQIVTFLARFAGVEDDASGYSHGFTDVKATDYYNNAVAWAKDHKVTEGTSATTFSPNTDCTRAQVVTFLYRWMVK